MIYTFDHKNKKYFYSPIKKLIIDVEKVDNPIWSFLNQNLNPPLQRKHMVDLTNFRDITIGFTRTCNLGCTYCYASAEPVKSVMSKKLQDRLFRLIDENKSKKVGVSFFSVGESLTHEEEVVAFCERLLSLNSENKRVIIGGIVTNATLINERNVDKLCSIFHNFNISYDGLPDIQNAQRPYANDSTRNSNDAVVKAMQLLGERNHSFGIRGTIGHKGISRMMEMFEFCSQFKIKYLHLEPLCVAEEGGGRAKDSEAIQPEDIDLFVENIIKGVAYLKEKNIRLTTSGLPKELNARSVNCGVAHPMLRIGSTGKFTACSRLDGDQPGMPTYYNYGYYDEITDEFILDTEAINRIQSSMNVENFSECADCFAKYHCAGGCNYTRVFNGNIKTSCEITKLLTKWYLFNNNEINKIDFQ